MKDTLLPVAVGRGVGGWDEMRRLAPGRGKTGKAAADYSHMEQILIVAAHDLLGSLRCDAYG